MRGETGEKWSCPDYRKAVLRWIPVVNIVRGLWRMACLNGCSRLLVGALTPLFLVCILLSSKTTWSKSLHEWWKSKSTTMGITKVLTATRTVVRLI